MDAVMRGRVRPAARCAVKLWVVMAVTVSVRVTGSVRRLGRRVVIEEKVGL
jgi:hypothetical protein